MHDPEAPHPPPIRSFRRDGDGFRWDSVDVRPYKENATHFHAVTRQVLFDSPNDLGIQARYFELGPDGHSTLERHAHIHAVVILRGKGHVVVGEAVHDIHPYDLVYIPPMTWHQFCAGGTEPLGFLCLVPATRDRPQRPTREEADALRSHPVIGPFVRL